MTKSTQRALNGLLIILMIVIFTASIAPSIDFNTQLENFENPGKYPISVDQPLLYGDYKVSKHPSVSKNGSEQNYLNYTVFPATSCTSNNIRYWRRPTNGKCSRADFCGNLYEDTQQDIPPPVPAPQWDDGIRVNYYESSD
jgi:hypothetical protein